MGLMETGDGLLKAKYHELVTPIGAVFKDMKTRQFLDCYTIARPPILSTWKKGLVGTVYLLDVAP